MKALGGVIGALCVLQAAVAAGGPAADSGSGGASGSSLPMTVPPVIDDWVPRTWWQPIDTAYGRVNDDALDDLVVVLQRPQFAPEDPDWPRGSRALLVLFQTARGGWRRGPLVPGLLPCADCTATLSGTAESVLFDISIPSQGVVEIGWVQRRHSTKAVRLRFGWDSGSRELMLVADDVSVINPYDGRSRVRRDYRRGVMWVNGQPRDMPPEQIRIEDVSAAAY